MYYDTPPALRFDKPAVQAIIDMINKSNCTFFEYSEIEVGIPTALVDDASGKNSVVYFTLKDRTDCKGTRRVMYDRLNINKFVGVLPVYFAATEMTALAAALAHLNQKFKINIDETQCDIDWLLEEPTVDETWPVLVIPNTDHLIWNGQALVYAVPVDHIALAITVQDLPGLKLTDLLTTEGIG